MPSNQPQPGDARSAFPFGAFTAASEYWIDAAQRSILFWDVMRERGNAYREHLVEIAPHVLDYQVELLLDGRTFARPVNYVLVRVIPPQGTRSIRRAVRSSSSIRVPATDRASAGSNPTAKSGSPSRPAIPAISSGSCPIPCPARPSRTSRAPRRLFSKRSSALHPDGRRQALRHRQLPGRLGGHDAGGRASRAVRPDHLRGIAAVLLGRRARQKPDALYRRPSRRQLAHRAHGDLGGGKFDGAWLVQNFENLNPANTLWSKQYNLYAKIDTEAERYLGFERWWGGHVNLNAEEIQFIVDELFVGNRLAAGLIRTSDGAAIDLRTIRSPIVVFCSQGTTSRRRSRRWGGFSISMMMSRRSGPTARPSCTQFMTRSATSASSFPAAWRARSTGNSPAISTSSIRFRRASMKRYSRRKSDATANPDLVTGDWVMRCEMRTLDDIRALGGNDARRRTALCDRGVCLGGQSRALSDFRPAGRPCPDHRYNRSVDASMPSVAAAIRTVQRCQSVHGTGGADGAVGARASLRRREGQSVRRHAGTRLLADRTVTRRVARLARHDGRTDVPFDLWITRAAGRLRCRSDRDAPAAKGGGRPVP